MAFEELQERTEEIQENVKTYIESTVAYYKLWGFKVAMKSTTLILKFVLIAICLAFFLLFLSILMLKFLINFDFCLKYFIILS